MPLWKPGSMAGMAFGMLMRDIGAPGCPMLLMMGLESIGGPDMGGPDSGGPDSGGPDMGGPDMGGPDMEIPDM